MTHARRQYDAVDPANRLVAAELERRWNQALTTEAQLEAELATLQQVRERPLSDGQKRELLDFARDVPKLWDDPQSSPEHKKRLLRIALKEIIPTCDGGASPTRPPWPSLCRMPTLPSSGFHSWLGDSA